MATKGRKEYLATGRRKTATARVRLYPGEGNILVNGKTYNDYFGRESLNILVQKPLAITDSVGKYDIVSSINGGGTSSQAGALTHGIARALVKMNEDFKKPLKVDGLLTRDSREKERRKVGHRKARRSPQYSKP